MVNNTATANATAMTWTRGSTTNGLGGSYPTLKAAANGYNFTIIRRRGNHPHELYVSGPRLPESNGGTHLFSIEALQAVAEAWTFEAWRAERERALEAEVVSAQAAVEQATEALAAHRAQ